tara:strand:- start:1890 stop:2423 length:534 start_codon:yes stop_codon:yes gene_type:complete
MSDEEVVNKKEVEEVSTKAAEKSGKKKKSKKDAKVRSASSASQLEMRHIKEANEENQDLKIEEEDKGSGVKKKKKSKGKSAQSGPSSPTIVIDSVGSAKGKEKEVVVDKCPVDFRRPGSTRRLSLQDTKKVMDAVACTLPVSFPFITSILHLMPQYHCEIHVERNTSLSSELIAFRS